MLSDGGKPASEPFLLWLGSRQFGVGMERLGMSGHDGEEYGEDNDYSQTMHTMSDTVRIDKWLWAARFFKTRSLASDAVEGGKVRLNGERIKPARNLKLGDVLQIDNGSTEWEVAVQGLSDKRGPAVVAQTLYAETEESMIKRQEKADRDRYFREPSTTIKGRPTKRDRRSLDKSHS
jgi:ribosome-associated heat shock protein Hsp15